MNVQLRGPIAFRLLRALCKPPQAVSRADDAPPAGPQGAAKLERFLGRGVWRHVADRRVLDFGCGHGAEAVAVAQRGAEMVYGIDIQEHRLAAARRLAEEAGVGDRCVFLNAATQAGEVADLHGTIDCAYSIDSFEHYARPDEILAQLHEHLAPGGQVLISFGPPWKNPYGCHLRYLCRWPWIHLVFAEETILAVRALYRDDGARRFEEVDGGLNRMTLARFLQLVRETDFQLDQFRPIPLSTRFVNSARFWQPLFTTPLTREYLTSAVLCRLTKPALATAVRNYAMSDLTPSDAPAGCA